MIDRLISLSIVSLRQEEEEEGDRVIDDIYNGQLVLRDLDSSSTVDVQFSFPFLHPLDVGFPGLNIQTADR
jgi:hypothetical protein